MEIHNNQDTIAVLMPAWVEGTTDVGSVVGGGEGGGGGEHLSWAIMGVLSCSWRPLFNDLLGRWE